jgi:hypothetical protein
MTKINDQAAENATVLAHLNMLQSIISRLAGNSAQCKTWCLSLVSALIAFAGAAHNRGAFIVTILPIAMFLMLDAAYLGNEIAYRNLFNQICVKVREDKYQSADLFVMGASLNRASLGKALKSWSIYIFYYPLVVLYVIAVNYPDLMKALDNVK